MGKLEKNEPYWNITPLHLRKVDMEKVTNKT